jgi:hypothetical protein
MTHLRKMMLEELERRNYAQTTIEALALGNADCHSQPCCGPKRTKSGLRIWQFE